MKSKSSLTSKVFLITIIAIISLISCKKEEKKGEPKEEKVEEAIAADYKKAEKPCLCESSWFPHSQTMNPKEGKGSPFDVSSTTNCIFHQWSWQKFLWLTKSEGSLPLFLNQKEVVQVDDQMIPVSQYKESNIVLEYTEQAGSNGILKTNPAYNSSNKAETVYYSIHANPIMLKAAEDFKRRLNLKTKDSLPHNNLEVFPVGSFELKASWVDINAIPADKQVNYYTTKATIIDPPSEVLRSATMALLGIHVVGVVENHPEFIWATFEHNDMAPNYNWKSNSADSSTEKLLFTKGSTTGLDGITYVKNKGVKIPSKAYDLFQYGVPVDASGFLETSQPGAVNFNNIQSINSCVAEKLKDVWNHYFYNGSIWLDTDGMTPKQQAQKIVDLGGNIGNATPGSSARGSLNCANVTMETFTQTFQSNISDIKVSNLANCFSCHAGRTTRSNTDTTSIHSLLYVSHIFDALIIADKRMTRDEINAL